MKQLDPDWMQWLAENRLLEQPTESIIAAMTACGFDRRTCEDALVELESHPFFKAARNHQQLHRKLESITGNLQELWQTSSKWPVIERLPCPSRTEFLERFVHPCRPVILTDVAREWPAMRRWSPACLRERFADLFVEIQAGRAAVANYEENKETLRTMIRFGEFLDRIEGTTDSNDCYLTANNELLKRPEFASLMDDIGTLPSICDPAQLAGAAFFWVGPGGTNTPLHHDTVMLFHAQIIGRKRWRFISPLETPNLYNYNGVFSAVNLDQPDFERHPRFRKVKVLEAVVEPGEIIYLPLVWWHQVAALALSVSLSFTNLDIPNSYSYVNPNLTHW